MFYGHLRYRSGCQARWSWLEEFQREYLEPLRSGRRHWTASYYHSSSPRGHGQSNKRSIPKDLFDWSGFQASPEEQCFESTLQDCDVSSRGEGFRISRNFLTTPSFPIFSLISSASLPAILSLFLLWLTMFLVWGIMLVEVFGLTKWGDNETYSKNFKTLIGSLVFLSMMSTG